MALPTILGLGLLSSQLSPSSSPAVDKSPIFPAPPLRSGAAPSFPQNGDPGPGLDRMMVAVPAELAAGPGPLSEPRDPGLPLTAFSQQNRPGFEPPEAAPAETPPQAEPPPQPPQTRSDDWWPTGRHLVLLPSLDTDGDTGSFEGASDDGGSGAQSRHRGRRGRGARRGRRR